MNTDKKNSSGKRAVDSWGQTANLGQSAPEIHVCTRFPSHVHGSDWNPPGAWVGICQRWDVGNWNWWRKRKMATAKESLRRKVDQDRKRHVGKECRSRWSPYH